MYIKNIRYLAPIKALRLRAGYSEREVATQAGVARLSVRHVEQGQATLSLQTISSLAQSLGREVSLLACDESCASEFSTACVSMKVHLEKGDSWKIHFFNLVDEFRRQLNPELLILPPIQALDEKAKALLASMCLELCAEAGMDAPSWAQKTYYLKDPYFPSRSEALKASAILESPLNFRKNNIFVLSNFMRRV
jgi:transcriptional regulator with XRE-family HTH domain